MLSQIRHPSALIGTGLRRGRLRLTRSSTVSPCTKRMFARVCQTYSRRHHQQRFQLSLRPVQVLEKVSFSMDWGHTCRNSA